MTTQGLPESNYHTMDDGRETVRLSKTGRCWEIFYSYRREPSLTSAEAEMITHWNKDHVLERVSHLLYKSLLSVLPKKLS